MVKERQSQWRMMQKSLAHGQPPLQAHRQMLKNRNLTERYVESIINTTTTAIHKKTLSMSNTYIIVRSCEYPNRNSKDLVFDDNRG